MRQQIERTHGIEAWVNVMNGIEIRRTHHSLLPWRLWADGKPVPHASCRTRRDIDALKARLEEVADWSQMNEWDEDTFVAVRKILADNGNAQALKLYEEG